MRRSRMKEGDEKKIRWRRGRRKRKEERDERRKGRMKD